MNKHISVEENWVCLLSLRVVSHERERSMNASSWSRARKVFRNIQNFPLSIGECRASKCTKLLATWNFKTLTYRYGLYSSISDKAIMCFIFSEIYFEIYNNQVSSVNIWMGQSPKLLFISIPCNRRITIINAYNGIVTNLWSINLFWPAFWERR
jgi:hypothetical protein